MHPKVLLGDEARLKARFILFEDSANLDTRLVHSLRRKYHMLRNHFGHTRWNCSVMWVLWNLVSVRFETLLVLVQDRCTVCAKRTIGSKIIFDTPHGTPRLRGSTGAHSDLFGDSANFDAIKVHGLQQKYHRLKNHFGRTG
jgi:hypothetical protein